MAISISSPLPGLPAGKPAGLPCPFLDESLRCALFGRPERPAVCASLKPLPEMCGSSREEAMAYLAGLERLTAPGAPVGQASGAGPEAPDEEPRD